jgi:hypothetical protein
VPRIGPLNTVTQIQTEAARLYRRALRGDIESDVATRLANVLRLVLECAKASEIEMRLLELERLLEGKVPPTYLRAA